MKQYEVLEWASSFLNSHHCETQVAEILLQHFLKVSRSSFYMTMQEEISSEIIARYQDAIYKHVETGIPVQHITGYESFYGRNFSVNEHTLVPRPETEELVLHVVNEIKSLECKTPIIVDVGTGSGVIAITLALEMPNALVYATDISKEALKVAKKNATDLGATIYFLEGDFLQPIIGEEITPHVIVSNPPYISRKEESSLSRTVKDFDPALALFAEEDGLAAYEEITSSSTKLSFPPRILAYEIGNKQAEAVKKIIRKNYPHGDIVIKQDINTNNRIVSINTK